MTDQNKNIETLQTEVNQVKTDTDDVKKETSEDLKKVKAEMIKNKAETVKEKINKELESLKGLTDETSIENTKKLEAMLVTLDTLAILKADITAPNVEQPPKVDKPEEKKNWFKRQREGLSDKTEENHTVKNIGRVVGGAGVAILAWKGIKKLFSIGKNKEKKEGNTTEKRGFRGKAWDVVKVVGIGGGIYYIIHGLVTGSWNMSDFFNWNKKNETNPKSIEDRYESEVPAELKPKYEKFGGTVDEFRKGIGNTDSLGVLQDEKHKDVIIPKGAIPAMLDKTYDNVGTILSKEYVTDKRKDTGGRIRDTVKGLGKKAAGYLLRPFIGAIKGLQAKFFGSDGEPNEEFQKWAETPDATRDEQIENLMTKYAMVRRYLSDKKEQLARTYAIQELTNKNITNPTEEEIQDSLDENRDIIEEKIETNFNSKKIAAIKDEDSVISTLEEEKIYDNSPSEKTKVIAEEVKERKDEVIPDQTIWEKAKNSPDINKDDALLAELNGVSDRFGAYLKKGLLHRNILEKMANCRGILNLDELWNGDADDLEEAMEALGIETKVKESKKANSEFMEKLRKKTLTKEDITKFEKAIDDYFNKENEILQEAETNNGADSEKGRGENAGFWLQKRFIKLTHTTTGRVIMGTGFLYARYSGVRKVVNGAISIPLSILKGVSVNPVFRNVNMTSRLGINKRTKLRVYTNTKKGFEKFTKDFKAGKIPGTEAYEVFAHRKEVWEPNKGFNDRLAGELNLRRIGNLGIVDQASLIREHFDSDNIRKIVKNTKNMDFGTLAVKLNTYNLKVKSLSGDAKTFCAQLFEYSKFKSLDDIDVIVKYIDDIDIAGLSPSDFKRVAKELGKDIPTFKTIDEINDKIKEIKRGMNIAPDFMDLINKDTAKIKIAEGLRSSRTVKGYPGEFNTGGKLDNPKYASFKTEYEAANKLASKARDAKYADIDKRLAEQLFADKHPLAMEILDINKTKELTEFGKNIDDEIIVLNKEKGLLTGTSPSDKLATKAIDKKITDLAEIRDLAKTMKAEELDAFEALYDTLKKAKPGTLTEITNTWELAKKDEKLMKALAGGDAEELKRLKKQGTVIPDEVIQVFEEIKIKKIAKILESADADKLLKGILKAFARLT